MNIIFLFNKPFVQSSGGVERVTISISNYLKEKNHEVYFISPKTNEEINIENHYFFPENDILDSQENINFLINVFSSRKIDVIINQCGNFKPALTLLNYAKQNRIKTISVIHNSPLGDSRYFFETHFASFEKHKITFLKYLINYPFIDYLYRNYYKKRNKNALNYFLKLSDRVILLSKNYKTELEWLTDIKDIINVRCIPNPTPFKFCKVTKSGKIVLFVGRISINQKRQDILIKSWAKIYNKFPDWKLIIVGDGIHLDWIKQTSIKNNINNIEFTGNSDPRLYYEKASIFCMTSSYEGFPMTLLESMQHGVVPIAFNSFSSITDIIDNMKNGVLVKPFDINEFSQKMDLLMSDTKVLKGMSENALLKIKEFEIEKIGEEWVSVLNELILCNRSN